MTPQRRREIGSSAHIAGEKAWAFIPTRRTTERGYLEGNLERQSQTRPCSTAKRVAAAREPTPSLR